MPENFCHLLALRSQPLVGLTPFLRANGHQLSLSEGGRGAHQGSGRQCRKQTVDFPAIKGAGKLLSRDGPYRRRERGGKPRWSDLNTRTRSEG